MIVTIDPTLFIDLQALPPVGPCAGCGGESYRPGGLCLRCERRQP